MGGVAPKVVVKGASCSGKTALAARLSAVHGVPHVELDALFHGPGWTEPPAEEFRRRVANATAGDGWVADGGYEHWLGDSLDGRADLIVWLDPPLRLIVRRLLRRTSMRIRDRTELWAGNRERWRNVFVGWNALLPYAARKHHRLRRELPARAERLRVPLVRLRTAADADEWLESSRRRASPPAAHQRSR